MNTKKIANILFAALFICCHSLFAQTSIFQMATDTTAAPMSSGQIANYRILLHNEHYSSFKVITTSDIESVVDSSRIYISLPFLEDTDLTFLASSFDYQNDSNFTWVGQYDGDTTTAVKYGTITILKHDGLYIGHLNLDNSSYELFDLTGGLQIFCKSILSGTGVAEPDSSNDNSALVVVSPGDNQCQNFTTRVLFVYSSETLQFTPDIVGSANLALSQNNSIWLNTNIENYLVLAGVEQVYFYTGFTTAKNDVDGLMSDPTIQGLRTTYKADIVIFLAPILNGVTGIAEATDANFAQAYGIVQVNAATDGSRSFAAVIGQLYGATFGTPVTSADVTGFDSNPSNAHAATFLTECTGIFNNNCNERKTVLQKLNANESAIDYHSDPSINFHNVATGDASHNNGQQIKSRLYHVANFVADPISKFGFMWAGRTTCSGFDSYPVFNVGVCDNDDATITYSWYFSFDGINWSLQYSGGPTWAISGGVPVTIGYYVKCIVGFGNSRFYNLQMHLPGGCSYFRTATAFPIENLTGVPSSYNGGRMTNIAPKVADQNDLSIFPNPSTGDFSLQFLNQSAKNLKIIVYDYTGRQIDNIENNGIRNGINKLDVHLITKPAKGLYFVKVIGPEKTFVKPITIE